MQGLTSSDTHDDDQTMQSDANEARERTEVGMTPVTALELSFPVDQTQFKAWQHDDSELNTIFSILESDKATLKQKKNFNT